MKNITSLKQSIARITDRKQLTELSTYIKERSSLLYKRQEEAAKVAAWERVKDLPVGTNLWCNANGWFLGGAVQRGTQFRIYCKSQPRAKRIWTSIVRNGKDEGVYWFGPEGVHRYNLQLTPPESGAVSDKMTASLAEVGKVLNEVIGS
jgi:hypothetical protein